MARKLYEIANIINRDPAFRQASRSAMVYSDAMQYLNTIDDKYGLDSGKEIVLRFLANAGTWRGETARNIKKELNAMVK
jgi:hypothetical protein